MDRLIIATAGHPASGKGTLAKEYFEPRGFDVISGSDILRQWAAEEGVELRSRQDYDAFHKLSRLRRGPQCLARTMLALQTDRLHIDGLRNFADYSLVKQAGGLVVALECPPEIRFIRGLRDKSHRYPPGFIDFIEAEKPEYKSPDIDGSHTSVVMRMADFTINSALDLPQVIAQLDTFVAPLLEDA